MCGQSDSKPFRKTTFFSVLSSDKPPVPAPARERGLSGMTFSPRRPYEKFWERVRKKCFAARREGSSFPFKNFFFPVIMDYLNLSCGEIRERFRTPHRSEEKWGLSRTFFDVGEDTLDKDKLPDGSSKRLQLAFQTLVPTLVTGG